MTKLLWLILLGPLTGTSQNYGYFAGGRSSALAHSSVALEDIWSGHHNQAGLGFLENTALGLSYENRFFLRDLALANLAFAHPSKLGTFGFSISHFGFELYHESKFGLNYSRAFTKKFSFGLQFNYQAYYVEEGSGNPSAITFETGFLVKPLKNLNLGFHLFNPTSTFKNSATEESLAAIARLGAQYKLSPQLALNAEVKKSQNVLEYYSLGVECIVAKPLTLRTGIGLQPFKSTVGLGLKLNDFLIDISYAYAQVLANSGNVSLQYHFK